MPLSLACTCGKSYQVNESLAGKRVKCKACGASLTVPQPGEMQPATAADDDDFRLSPLETPAARPAVVTPRPAASPAPAAVAPTPVSAPTASPRSPASPAATAGPASALPFFLAVSQGWSKSLVYRVYVDQGALLLLDVAPYNVFLDLEVARRADGSHWGVKVVQSLKTWLLGSIAVIGSIFGILGLAFARAAFKQPNEALQLMSFLVIVAAIVVPGLILLATWSMRVLVRRTQALDALDAAGIREESAKGGDKYRLAPGELSQVRIAPPKNPGPAIRHRAEATFKHPSGSWKLLLFADQDVKQAVATFRRLLGPAVEVDSALV
jgi:hypothetical protein